MFFSVYGAEIRQMDTRQCSS